MSAHDDKSNRSLTKSGRSRRAFLENTTLTAAVTSVGLIPGLSASATGAQRRESREAPAARRAATRSSDAAPATCPTVPVPPMKDVEGKVAFITGGDSGIGLGIARACTDAGMKVVITYRTQAHLDEAMKLLGSASDRVHAINLDVTDRTAM